ncbi:MAG: kelch repeat-containing protein [Pseudomonadota bacterium]
MRGLCALLLGLGGCVVLGPADRAAWHARSEVVLEPVFAPGHEGDLAGVGSLRLTVAGAEPGWSDLLDWPNDDGLLRVELPAQDGPASLLLEGFSGYEPAGGFQLLFGAADAVALEGGTSHDLPLFLAPVEQPATLETPASFGAALASDGAGRFYVFGGSAAGLSDEAQAEARDEIAVLTLSEPGAGIGLQVVGSLATGEGDTGLRGAGRMSLTATRLVHGEPADTGLVLLTGGWEAFDRAASVSDEVLLFDPASRTLMGAGTLREPRAGHAAFELDDGRVLIAGGYGWAPAGEIACARTVEVWDPATREVVRSFGPLPGCLVEGAGAALGAQVLWCGGLRMDADGFGAEEGCWLLDADAEPEPLPSPLEPGQGLLLPALAPLGPGRALLVGGAVVPGSLPRLAGAEEDWAWAQAGSWILDATVRIGKRTPGDLLLPRAAHTALALPDGRVLVAGGAAGLTNLGRNVRDPTACAEIYDMALNAWELLQPCVGGAGFLPTAAHRVGGAVDPLYGALLYGGLDLRESTGDATLFTVAGE